MRRSLLFSILSVLALSATAAPLTPKEALERVTATRNNAATDYRLTYTVTDACDTPGCYVFNNQTANGFIILSADDSAPAILGYSDSGNFDEKEASPEMKWWLESYASQIAWLQEQEILPVAEYERPQRAPIAPICKTLWHQHGPYNSLCPTIYGAHTVAGCAAIAIAQVMAVHRWPEHPAGIHKYNWIWDNTELGLNFSQVTFYWDDILDSYSNDTPDEQREAVASLCYANGIAIDMQYTLTASGAKVMDMYKGLLNNFGYDKGLYYADRDIYPLEDWETLVYNQLAAGEPIVYIGQGPDGGHAFVCDGYADDGYFHINWGWGGISDGYFLLTALNPEIEGTGGGGFSYNYSQTAMMGIRKPQPNSDYTYQIYMPSFGFPCDSVAAGETIEMPDMICNISVADLTGCYGLKFTPENGGETTYAEGAEFSLGPFGNCSVEASIPKNLIEGITYRVTPVFRPVGNEWKNAQVYLCGNQYALARMVNGTIFFTNEKDPLPRIKDISIDTHINPGEEFIVTATVENMLDRYFYGTLYAALTDYDGNIMATAGKRAVDLGANETESLIYKSSFRPTGDTLPNGIYLFVFMIEDALGESHPAMQPIRVAVGDYNNIKAINLPGDGVSEIYTSVGLPAREGKGIVIEPIRGCDGKTGYRKIIRK